MIGVSTRARSASSPTADGLQQPIGLAFGPRDGLLYVVSSIGRSVMRFDPETGRSRDVFATDSLSFPSDLTFGPDGDLYVTNASSASVVRLEGQTGAFVETYARLPGRGGAPVGLALLPDSSLAIGDFARADSTWWAPGAPSSDSPPTKDWTVRRTSR